MCKLKVYAACDVNSFLSKNPVYGTVLRCSNVQDFLAQPGQPEQTCLYLDYEYYKGPPSLSCPRTKSMPGGVVGA